MNRINLMLIGIGLMVLPLVALVRYAWSIVFNPEKAFRIAIAFDRVLNVACNGSEYETVSSRAAKARNDGKRWGCVLCKVLDAIEKDHCTNSIGV